MSGVFLGLIFLVATTLINRSGGSSRQPGDNIERSAFFFVEWAGATFLGVVGLLIAAEHPWVALALWSLVGLLVAPWLIVRTLLLPRGHVRATYYLSQLAAFTLGRDDLGGALLAATLAERAAKTSSASTTRFLRRRFERLDELRGGGAVAWALFCAPQLEPDDLDGWLDFQRFVDWRVTPKLARALTSEYAAVRALELGDALGALQVCERLDSVILNRGLAVAAEHNVTPDGLIDAAHKGDLDEVLARAGTRPFAKSASLRAITAIAQWQLAPDEPARMRWQKSLQRALRFAPTARPLAAQMQSAPAVSPPVSVGAASRLAPTDPLTRAVDTHVDFITDTAVRPPDEARLHALGLAWERVLYRPEVKGALLRRASELGVLRPERALAALEEDVAAALQHGVLRGASVGPPPDEESVLLRMARESALRAPLEALELATGSITMRVERAEDLPAVHEYEEMLRFYTLYQQAARIGADARSEAFYVMAHAITGWAIRLWNERKAFSLANAMFRFVAYEAMHVGDEEYTRINLDNLACRG